MTKPPANKIGRQIKLPLRKTVEIAWKNIRMRLSRTMVVTSGIILAMAFLMYILCSDYTVESMRNWSTIASTTPEFKAAQTKVQEIQPKVGDASDRIILASVALKNATGAFDEKKIFGKEFSSIQRELGAMPVSPDASKALLAARPDMVPVMQDWIRDTRTLREAKDVLAGPQNLTSLMKANGVPTSEKDIKNSKMQTKWLIGLALLVAFVGILNAMLMSVTERFREIGTMKCLGALDSFIVKLFMIESFFQGGAGTIAGVLLGLLLNVAGISITYGVFAWKMFPYANIAVAGGICLVVGILLTVGGAVYPAWRAARMHPIEAMRADT